MFNQKKFGCIILLLAVFLITGCTQNGTPSDVPSSELNSDETVSAAEDSNDDTMERETGPMQTDEYIDLFSSYQPVDVNPSETDPHFTSDKDEYLTSDIIVLTSYNCGQKDWIGLYPYGGYPGDMYALSWTYANNSKTVSIPIKTFENETKYVLYLCQNDVYDVLDYKVITIRSSSSNDFRVTEASCEVQEKELLLTVTPPATLKLSYEIYWAKDGKRLEGYSYLKSFQKASGDAFTVSLGSYLVMPADANQLEISIVNSTSDSLFIDVSDALKIAATSQYLYSFNVYTDLHVQTLSIKPNHVSQLEQALNDAYNYNLNSKALFTVGDQTDTGSLNDYDCLTKIFNLYKEASGCPVYYTIGNHDYACSFTYGEEIRLFKQYANTDSIYYTVEMEGSTCIFLGSEERTTQGELSNTQVTWLQEQLDNADQSKPIFIFLHQPLIDTVAGSYASQEWYGITANGKKIEELLANYPNAVLFTGHTHWEMESNHNVMISETGTSYVNCASVGYLWNDDNSGEPGSEGYFVDVYDDCLVIRGRDFIKGEWLAYATYRIPLHFEK